MGVMRIIMSFVVCWLLQRRVGRISGGSVGARGGEARA